MTAMSFQFILLSILIFDVRTPQTKQNTNQWRKQNYEKTVTQLISIDLTNVKDQVILT